MLENFFSGPGDPEYVVLKFTPSYAEYWLGGQVRAVVSIKPQVIIN